jgi:hypothetical protein
MPVYRERITKNYTVIDNRILRDPRLKGEAKGLLVWLLSHHSQWKIIIPVVMKEMGWGRDKVYRLLKHLSELGYLHRSQDRDQRTGSFGEVSYCVYANPSRHPAFEGTASADGPLPDSPLPGKSKASKGRSKELEESPPTPAPVSELELGPARGERISPHDAPRNGDAQHSHLTFERFWTAYAPDPYMSRHAAERKWQRMGEAHRQKATESVTLYFADCKASGRKRVNAVRYLRERIWDGYSVIRRQSTVTLSPGSPQWIKWREYYVAIGQSVSFMDARASEGKIFEAPTEWPPNESNHSGQ